MKLKNEQMAQMLDVLRPHLERKDMLGYAAAYNTRVMSEAATEYLTRRDELVREFGEAMADEEGRPTGEYTLSSGSEGFAAFSKELAKYKDIEHDVDVLAIDPKEAIGSLTGAQMLAVWWMFKESSDVDNS